MPYSKFTVYDIFNRYISSKAFFSEEEFERIRSLSTIKKLRKKQYLLQEGDICKHHAFVAEGCFRIYQVDEKGMEHILKFAIENWWAADAESMLNGLPSKFNIDAIEDSTVILFSKPNFETICNEIPAFKDMVNTIMNKSFVASHNRIQAMISYTAEQKYLDFLKQYPDIVMRLPQGMIASYLGITPETLSRVRKVSAGK